MPLSVAVTQKNSSDPRNGQEIGSHAPLPLGSRGARQYNLRNSPPRNDTK